jgi:hypothetical protein
MAAAIASAIKYSKWHHLTRERSGVPAAASRNQFFSRLCRSDKIVVDDKKGETA